MTMPQEGPPMLQAVAFRLTPDDFDRLTERAEAAKVSVPAYVRKLVLMDLGRDAVPAEPREATLGEVLTAVEKMSEILKESVRALLVKAGGVAVEDVDDWVEETFS
jgi:hypothetical protein